MPGQIIVFRNVRHATQAVATHMVWLRRKGAQLAQAHVGLGYWLCFPLDMILFT